MKIWEDLLQDIEKNIPSDTECELKMMHSKSALTRFANSVSYTHLTLPTTPYV